MTATLDRPRVADDAPARSARNPRAVSDVRRTVLALVAAALGVLPLCELIRDNGWLLDVWVTMALVIAPAALLRLRRPPSAGQIWLGLVLLIPWLTARFVHSHALGFVIPGPGTWHDVTALMTDLHHTTTVQAAPVHSTTAIRLALCVLLGLVAALVDLVAVVGRRGALGGVPLLVVYTVSGAVPRHPVSWWLFAFAAAGFLILLALDSSDDLHRWGHYVPRANPLKGRTVETGQRIAIVAIALAVVIPSFVPSDSRNWIANLFHDGGSNGLNTGLGRLGGTGGIDPFVGLKGELDRKTPVNLFDVTIDSATAGGGGAGAGPLPQLFYARTNTLSNFIGKGWVVGSAGPTVDPDADGYDSDPGELPKSWVDFSVRVSVSNLSSNPPVFTLPTAVSGLSANTKWDPQDLLLVNSKIKPGDKYALTVRQPAPTVPQLEAATGVDGALAPWLALPKIDASVQQLVRSLTQGKQTPYDRARAISDYFTDGRNGFSYSLATEPGDSNDDLVNFLEKKTGYCQQYAAAMGVMLRLAGVPSRVVLGYTHSVPTASTGKFTVTTNDAHSWVEAYFRGTGWVPFDPTPLAGINGGSLNDLPWAPHKTAAPDDNSDVPTISKSVSAGKTASSSRSTAPAAAASSRSDNIMGVVLTLGVLALVLLLILVPWGIRERRRRVRLRRARHGDTDALWAELSDTAVDLGYTWSRARTPRQVIGWLAGPAGGGGDSLRTIAGAVERSRYAPGAPSADGRALVDDLARVRAGLGGGRSFGERVRSALFPASLGWSVMQLLPGRRRH